VADGEGGSLISPDGVAPSWIVFWHRLTGVVPDHVLWRRMINTATLRMPLKKKIHTVPFNIGHD